jgi:hypothetical protein
VFDGASWTPTSSITPGGTAGGDLGGTYPNPSVTKLRGVNVANVGPSTGQALVFDGANWTPSSSITPGGTAGGDLGGTYPNPSVTKLRGVNVANVGPSTGQVLKFDGANWTPSADNGLILPFSGSASSSPAAVFDVTNSNGSGSGIRVRSQNTSSAVTSGVALDAESSTASTLRARNNGSGATIDASNSGTGNVILAAASANAATGNVIQIDKSGTSASTAGVGLQVNMNGRATGTGIDVSVPNDLNVTNKGIGVNVNIADVTTTNEAMQLNHDGTGTKAPALTITRGTAAFSLKTYSSSTAITLDPAYTVHEITPLDTLSVTLPTPADLPVGSTLVVINAYNDTAFRTITISGTSVNKTVSIAKNQTATFVRGNSGKWHVMSLE